MKFKAVCDTLDTFEKAGIRKHAADKKKALEQLFAYVRSNHPDDLFDLLRLLMPSRDRRGFDIKEHRFGDIYGKMLHLPKDQVTNIGNWKQPTDRNSIELLTRETELDFAAMLVENYISNRWTGVGDTQTVKDVNALLDELSQLEKTEKKSKAQRQEEIFHSIFMNYTPDEQKWLIRIIIKSSMKYGEDSVLRAFHPDAVELYRVCTDLRRVVEQCFDLNVRVLQKNIQLFIPFIPMHSAKELPENVVRQMKNEPFIMEEKLDGWRFLLHVDIENDKLMYVTRNSNDESELYGANSQQKGSKRFWPCFQKKAGIKNMILDGEMLVYDPATKAVENFGTLRSVASADDGEQQGKRPFFVVFDILLINDKSLVESCNLEQRKAFLNEVVESKEGVVKILDTKTGQTQDDVVEELENILLNRGEGVVIKDPKSLYIPDSRNGRWLKIKPDFITSLGEHLDVVIVGACYGHGDKSGIYSKFLVAISTGFDGQFSSLTRFGTGWSLEEFRNVHRQLKPHEIKYINDTIPGWLVAMSGHGEILDTRQRQALLGGEQIDVLFEPSKSIVVELKATQITLSNTGCGFNLRFPRLSRRRDDKSCNDVISWHELSKQYEHVKGIKSHLVKHGYGSTYDVNMVDNVDFVGQVVDDLPQELVVKKKRKGLNMAPQFVTAKLDLDVEDVGSLFRGLELCVLNGDGEVSKHDLETLILRGGGSVVLNPKTQTNFLVIGEVLNTHKNYINDPKWNILKPAWIIDSMAKDKQRPFWPKYITNLSEEMQKEHLKAYDVYGNSFKDELNLDEFKELLEQMDDIEDYKKFKAKIELKALHGLYLQNQELITDDIKQNVLLKFLEAELELYPLPGAFMRPVVAYMDQFEIFDDPKSGQNVMFDFKYVKLLRSMGGVVSDRLFSEVSHIIMDDRDQNRVEEVRKQVNKIHKRQVIVSFIWLDACYKEQSMLDEGPYEL